MGIATNLSFRLESLEVDEPWIVEKMNFEMLVEYLQPSSTTSPTAAAQSIDSLTPMKRDFIGTSFGEKEEAEGHMWEIWGLFIAMAKQVPHDHPSMDRLVALVYALAELPPTTVNIWTQDTDIWTHLPMLGPSVAEAWIGPGYYRDNVTPKMKIEWVNFNSFAARLLNHDMVSWYRLTVWSLRDALENPPREHLLDCDVAAAAQWIIHSGALLFSELEDDDAEPVNGRFWSGPLWKEGSSVLSVGRWKFWKQRFGEISEKETGQAGSAAEMARQKMDEIERNGVRREE